MRKSAGQKKGGDCSPLPFSHAGKTKQLPSVLPFHRDKPTASSLAKSGPWFGVVLPLKLLLNGEHSPPTTGPDQGLGATPYHSELRRSRCPHSSCAPACSSAQACARRALRDSNDLNCFGTVISLRGQDASITPQQFFDVEISEMWKSSARAWQGIGGTRRCFRKHGWNAVGNSRSLKTRTPRRHRAVPTGRGLGHPRLRNRQPLDPGLASSLAVLASKYNVALRPSTYTASSFLPSPDLRTSNALWLLTRCVEPTSRTGICMFWLLPLIVTT